MKKCSNTSMVVDMLKMVVTFSFILLYNTWNAMLGNFIIYIIKK